jgi:hypothetical protein
MSAMLEAENEHLLESSREQGAYARVLAATDRFKTSHSWSKGSSAERSPKAWSEAVMQELRGLLTLPRVLAGMKTDSRGRMGER